MGHYYAFARHPAPSGAAQWWFHNDALRRHAKPHESEAFGTEINKGVVYMAFYERVTRHGHAVDLVSPAADGASEGGGGGAALAQKPAGPLPPPPSKGSGAVQFASSKPSLQ